VGRVEGWGGWKGGVMWGVGGEVLGAGHGVRGAGC
jgi:hypothetical protein